MKTEIIEKLKEMQKKGSWAAIPGSKTFGFDYSQQSK